MLLIKKVEIKKKGKIIKINFFSIIKKYIITTNNIKYAARENVIK